jgi:hypothetical protein
MDKLFDIMTKLAIDPFACESYATEPTEPIDDPNGSPLTREELTAALTVSPADAASIANGPWAPCDTCSDPGGDDPLKRPPPPPVARFARGWFPTSAA